jgi:aminoglycoside phosphotransferase (APT) family kinase protein
VSAAEEPRHHGPAIPGIDRAALTTWLAERVDLELPVRFELVSGGRSNLTVRISDAGGADWVLRRPPTVGVLPSAHDVAREHRIITALAPTSVPVPAPVGVCVDTDVTGAPFYVMEAVTGHVLRTLDDAAALTPSARAALSESLVAALATLHAIDPAATTLADLGRHEGYLERQLRRLHRGFQVSGTRELPLVAELRHLLEARLPRQQRTSIVHGDYRLDNVVTSDDGEVVAILDWELCTLGDPLADLALLYVFWLEPGEETIPSLSSPTTLEGFASRSTVVERYASLTGLDLEELPTYVAFAFWKLALILDGVYARYRSGAYEEDHEVYEELGGAVPRLLERGHDALTRR